MTLDIKGRTPEENEALNQRVQEKMQPLLQELTREAGLAPLAAILVVHWGPVVSVSQTFAPGLPKPTLFSMLSGLSRTLGAHLESLRALMRTYKSPHAS